ncbi:melanoma-associated antigen B4-like [Choloepus didactylus]|uniref:melanoma-associated antigen B4-like n=1 Tax=Choloepus didactylus TaxID=27675 RepID=UPI00189F0167|nr:melanoma-associated antigen B4-like [Choloepus didactylus]
MPRGQKSKSRAREKRRQAQGETQGLEGAEAPAAEEEESPSPSSPVLGGALQCTPAAGIPQESQRSPPPTTPTKAFSRLRVAEGARCQDENRPSSFQATCYAESSCRDPLTRKARMLVEFLTEKYKSKEPITKAAMLKIVNKKYQNQFPEILRRTAERMELVFGLELKEVDPSGQSYSLVSKLDLTSEGNLSGGGALPRTGLLMTLLGVIFMKGNRATEEEIWGFLNALGVFAGRKHLIFGEPRRLLTKDLVQEKYLEYQQVPDSDPPRYEFLWGSRAHAETSKMKVLEVLAKINDTVPSSFPALYEEALRDEQERAGTRVPVTAGTTVPARARPRASASSSSCK